MLLDIQEYTMLIGNHILYKRRTLLSVERHLNRTRGNEIREIAAGGTKLKIG